MQILGSIFLLLISTLYAEPIKANIDNNTSENFSLDMELSKTEALVGEPIIVTIKFGQIKGINVVDIEYQQPKFKGFFNKVIGEQKNYIKENYSYMELRYLLIAKHDGNMRLDPACIKVAVASGKRKFGGWFSKTPKWSHLISDSPLLTIKKNNGDFDILGDYTLKDNIDIKEVETNKPVNLKIQLQGEGNLDDYEGLKFDISGVTVYSDDAKIESKLVGEELKSRYIKQFVFISDHNFTIPSKTIRLYNYKTGEIDELKTKEYQIKIKGLPSTDIIPTVYTKNRVTSSAEIKDKEVGYEIDWVVPSWAMLLGAFILGMVTTPIIYISLQSFSKFRFKGFRIDMDKALIKLYPRISESREVEDMVRVLYDKKQGKKVKIDKTLLKSLMEKYSD